VLLQHGHKVCSGQDDLIGSAYLRSLLGEQEANFKSIVYRSIVQEYYRLEQEGHSNLNDHFINHETTEYKNLALEFLFDSYTYAEWSERGVELQTQKPIDENHEKDIYQAVMMYFMRFYKHQEKLWKEKIAECNEDDKKLILLTAYKSFKEEMKEHAEKLNTVVL